MEKKNGIVTLIIVLTAMMTLTVMDFVPLRIATAGLELQTLIVDRDVFWMLIINANNRATIRSTM
jgi:hypothetical protein